MLNALWAFMMLTGLGWATVHGTLGGGDGGNACSGGGCSLAGNHDAGGDGVLDGNFGDRTAGGAD